MWTTNESGDMEECDVLFLNRGKLMFEAVESIEVEEEEDKEAQTVAEKEDPTYYPKDEEEEYQGGGDGEDEEEEGDGEEEGEGEEEGDEEEGDDEVECGEKCSLAVAVVPSVPKQTPKKESIQFSTLTRSARKRQQEQMMRDVETEMDLNRKKEEVTKIHGAPVTGKPIKKPVEGVLVTTETECVPAKSSEELCIGKEYW